jgi:hypothetical protein
MVCFTLLKPHLHYGGILVTVSPKHREADGSNSDTWVTANSPALIYPKKPMQQAVHNTVRFLEAHTAAAGRGFL